MPILTDHLVNKCKLFGQVNQWNFWIEWQNGGLPSAHILSRILQCRNNKEKDENMLAEIRNLHKSTNFKFDFTKLLLEAG